MLRPELQRVAVACFEGADPQTLGMALEVGAEGRVRAARVTAGPPRLASCVLGVLRRASFPETTAPSTVGLTMRLTASTR